MIKLDIVNRVAERTGVPKMKAEQAVDALFHSMKEALARGERIELRGFGVFVVQPVKVEGTSMLPRLHDGERIFVNKLIYYGVPPLERGDIVVFWYPEDPSKSYIKRLIGLPGETVQLRAGRIFVNGKELQEPYLEHSLNVAAADEPPTYVKPHYYFVMGDNRDHSSDSRYWGLVPEKYIYGKALFRYWPPSAASVIRHETDYPGIPAHRVERFDEQE